MANIVTKYQTYCQEDMAGQESQQRGIMGNSREHTGLTTVPIRSCLEQLIPSSLHVVGSFICRFTIDHSATILIASKR